MMEYREFTSALLDRIMALYQEEGWNLYTDREVVRRAWDRSVYRLGAFEGETLLGFIRCTGDGEYDLLVSDLLVAKSRRRQGVGKALLSAAMERYAHVDNFILMTGLEEEDNNRFYRSMGMREFQKNRLIGYIR